MHHPKTAILLSGGIDSISLAYWKRPSYAFTINYGQKPATAEIQAAQQVSRILGIEHHTIEVDCSRLGSGDLSDNSAIQIAPVSEWWPYRNQLLVTLACMKAITLGVDTLYVGSVITDESHRDGTERFYSILSELMKYQEGEIEIVCPSIKLTSSELVSQSRVPSSVLLWAHSCHTSNGPCMKCNGCYKYLFTMQQLGLD